MITHFNSRSTNTRVQFKLADLWKWVSSCGFSTIANSMFGNFRHLLIRCLVCRLSIFRRSVIRRLLTVSIFGSKGEPWVLNKVDLSDVCYWHSTLLFILHLPTSKVLKGYIKSHWVHWKPVSSKIFSYSYFPGIFCLNKVSGGCT